MYYFNSRDEYYKKPFGAVKEMTEVIFSVSGRDADTAPLLCIKKDGGFEQYVEMQRRSKDNRTIFVAKHTFTEPGLYFYRFNIAYGDDLYNNGKGETVATQDGEWFIQTVYSKEFSTPDIYKGGILYQIFPDRFCEGRKKDNLSFPDRVYREDKRGLPFYKWGAGETEKINTDYFGGDFEGIIQQLGYLSSYGVNCIYLNPIFLAHSNHRYNTADYTKPDPELGSMEDFKRLCKAARENGIRIILDGVFSHTGSDSIYFNKEGRYGNGGAYNDENSPYRKWYDFDPKYKNGYRAWWDFETLPEVDESSPEYIEYICGEGGIIDRWLSRGASGFRLDVADELPDEFISQIRQAVKRNGEDKLLIGEVWEDAVTKISYSKRRQYLLGKGLDSVMNYPFRGAVLDFIKNGDGDKFCQTVFSIYEHYPKQALESAWNSLSTHDTPRALTVLSDDYKENISREDQAKESISPENYGKAAQDLVCAYALLFSLPGIPCIYYGDEAGMQGYKDPFNRSFFPWGAADGYIRRNIRYIASFRTQHDVYAKGGIHFVHVSYNAVAFVRFSENKEVLTAVNRGEEHLSFYYNDREYYVPPHGYINAVTK